MSKEAIPQFVRALVDFYLHGRLLYAKGNVYPLDDRLALLKARGEAEDHKPEKSAEPTKAQKAKPGQGLNSADSATSSDGSAADEAAKAPAASAAADAAATTDTKK